MNKVLKKRMEEYFDRLFDLPRSITGPGIKESIKILSEIIPVDLLKFPTGTQVFDWTVPEEWTPRDAYLIDPHGNKRAVFKSNNLHLVGYSIPFRGILSLSELKKYIHTLPEQPEAIPYLTSYYNRTWGFCMTHNEFRTLPDGDYQVVVDTELKSGEVVVGEKVLPGESDQEILFSSYLCHPSMASNELSGPLVMAFLYEKLASLPRRRYTYRFVLSAETIGTICYLSQRGFDLKKNLVAGYVMTCLGDSGKFTYKSSREENTLADRAAKIVLRDIGDYRHFSFDPTDGSDERQYCSPGFNFPVGSLMRTMYGHYPEYHTSLDNKEYISFDAMAQAVDVYFSLVKVLEANEVWINNNPYCEPQLGKRGLYRSVSSKDILADKVRAVLWLLNQADGTQDLISIAEKSKHKISSLIEAAQELSKQGLINRSDKPLMRLRKIK